MDETRKAASVAQLQELNKTVAASLEKSSTESAVAVGAVASRLITFENELTKLNAKSDQPQDLTPVIAAITELGATMRELVVAQGQQQMAMLQKLTELLIRPLTRTGEATLPDGGRIQLQVSETRM